LALFSRLGASFQKVGIVSLGISKLTLFVLLICPTLNDIREEHLYTLKCYLNNIQEGAYEAICENKQFCLTVQSHLHQIQYVHMAHGFPPPFCTGKKFLQDENGKILCSFFFY
jgi:hypothetical protein